MSTPQNPPRRRKQKARRAKQLAEWRAKKVTGAREREPAAGDKPAATKATSSK
jgi:hypothetical protein